MKTTERHIFVSEFKEKYPVKSACRILKISESGYYRWLRNRNKPTRQQLLLVEIKQILAEHPDHYNYGYSRMHTALEQKGIIVSEQTVCRAMKAGGLIHQGRRPHGLTKATTEIQEKENLIKRDFHADKPMSNLLTDITEVQCADGRLYISAVLDCYNGEIVALEMRDNMKKELCIGLVKKCAVKIYPKFDLLIYLLQSLRLPLIHFQHSVKVAEGAPYNLD